VYRERSTQASFHASGLGAQYRAARKTCQEEIAIEPQNIRRFVSKSSIYSGANAQEPQTLFAWFAPALPGCRALQATPGN
jgi:hypothetical protein